MERKAKIVRIINIILVVSMILRFCFVLTHINHDCTHDDNCLTCSLIHKFNSDISGFNPHMGVLITFVLLVFSSLLAYVNDKSSDKKRNTPVGLKVELIN